MIRVDDSYGFGGRGADDNLDSRRLRPIDRHQQTTFDLRDVKVMRDESEGTKNEVPDTHDKPVQRIMVAKKDKVNRSSFLSFISSISAETYNHHDFDLNDDFCQVFGREEEIEILNDALDRASKGASEVVALSGVSGSGKSLLVDSMRDSVSMMNGHFCHGQHDTLQSTEPFSAIANAFDDICDLVLQSDNLDAVRNAVNDALGDEVDTLSTLIPSLSSLLQRPHVNAGFDANTSQAFTRFKHNMKSLLRALATPEHPILLSLDNIHFANDEDLEIIKALTSDLESKYVLIAVTFTESDMNAETVLGRFLKSFESPDNMLNTILIRLGNLNVECVNKMVASLTDSSHNDTLELSKVIWSKTMGNPYFVSQFIEVLKSKELLTLTKDGRWEWDAARIQAETNCSENIVGLLEERIYELSSDVQRLLKLAACLGNTFDLDLLTEVSMSEKIFSKDVENDFVISSVLHKERFVHSLGISMKEGLIEKARRNQLKLSHEKLQQCLLGMMSVSDRQELHRRVGKEIMCIYDKSRASDDSLFFLAVDQLNRGPPLLTNDDDIERGNLIHFNILAGEKAKSKSAFHSARRYLRSALGQLDQEHRWFTNYAFTLAVFNALAVSESCCGNYEACKELTSEIILRAVSFEDKLTAYTLLISSFGARGELLETVALGRSVLSELGQRFPKKPTRINIGFEIFRTQQYVNGMSDADLMLLPEMTDRSMKSTMEILCAMVDLTFLADDKLFLSLIIARMMRLTLRYGLSNGAVQCFALWSLVATMIGKRSEAHRFGRLSVKLAEKRAAKKEEVVALLIVYCFSNHTHRPLRESIEAFQKAMTGGFQCGEIFWAQEASVNLVLCEFHCGSSLLYTEKKAREVYNRIVEYGHEKLRLLHISTWQCILKLMGLSLDPSVLNYDVVDSASLMQAAMQTKHQVTIFAILHNEFKLAFWFGEWDRAYETLKKIDAKAKMLPSIQVHFAFMELQFFSVIVHLEKAKESGSRKHRQNASRITKRLELFLSEGRTDCRPMVLLLKAEIARLNAGTPTKKVQEAFNQAILACENAKFCHYQAFANERAGRFSIERKDFQTATRYLMEAQALYDGWNAIAKSDDCEHLVETLFLRR